MRACIIKNPETNQLDVDIAYIKAKTIASTALVFGGIVASVVGAFVLTNETQAENSAVLPILGTEVTAKGIGAIIISSSAPWAYFAYLARPNYSQTKENRISFKADGTHSNYLFESATMCSARLSSPGWL